MVKRFTDLNPTKLEHHGDYRWHMHPQNHVCLYCKIDCYKDGHVRAVKINPHWKINPWDPALPKRRSIENVKEVSVEE